MSRSTKGNKYHVAVAAGGLLLFVIFLIGQGHSKNTATAVMPGPTTLDEKWIVCWTKASLEEATQFHIIAKDLRGFKYLVRRGKCFISKGGEEISVLGYPSLGTVKVRIYGKGKSRDAWTYREAILRR